MLPCSLVVVGTIFLLGTNPSQSSYASYAAEQLPKHLKEANCDELEGNVGILGLLKFSTKDTCKAFINGADSVGRGVIKGFINLSTERRNLYVFSIYTTRIAGREVNTLGIGKQFMTFD